MKQKNLTHILLIEDNPADAKLVSILLNDAKIKHHLQHIDTLYEGIELANSTDPDIILLDLSLPDSNGFKTVTAFLEKVKNKPVIVMTGLNDDIVGNQAIKAGAQDYLLKGEYDGKLLGRVIKYAVQRHKVQDKLAQTVRNLSISKRQYLEAQKMANFGNFEIDLVTNQMVWTEEVFRILGYAPNSINPTLNDYLNSVHFDEKDEVKVFFENAAKDGQRHKLEHKIIVNGRSIRYVLIHAKVYYDDITDKFLIVGGIQDITERKQHEELVIEKNINIQSSKMKDEVLADMGFHIRTPLSSILNLSYVLSNTELGTIETDLMAGLRSSVDDLSISINNLLNFSMLVSDKIEIEEEEIDLIDFVQRTKQLVQLKATQKNIDLHFEIAPSIPKVLKTDSNKLSQILYNLIDNAIKYTDPESGYVKIILSSNSIDSNNDTFNLVINVQDNGKGISYLKRKELLDSDILLQIQYQQEDKKQLGMAIINKLTKSLNGTIDIQSQEGKGSTFSINIPVKYSKEFSITSESKPNQALKILLVEDHFLNQLATKKVLTSWSPLVTVDIAENGLVGVEKYRSHGYDLILMDLHMPVMDGFEATRKLREHSTVPIIALTANSNKQEAEKCLATGMNDYLSKPIKPDNLYAKIMSILSKELVIK